MKILGVDPGLHTGVCLLDTSLSLVDICKRAAENSWQFEAEGFQGEIGIAREVLKIAVDSGIGLLAMEDFILLKLGSSERSGLSPVRITMAIDFAFSLYFGNDAGDSGSVLLRGSGGFGGGYGDSTEVLRAVERGESGFIYRKLQSPAFAKGTFTDERLKNLCRAGRGGGADGDSVPLGGVEGIWKGLSAHQRDAWRHALTAAKSAGMLRQ